MDHWLQKLGLLLDGVGEDFEHFLENSLIKRDENSNYSEYLLQVGEQGLIDDLRLLDTSIGAFIGEVLRSFCFELELTVSEAILKDLGSWADLLEEWVDAPVKGVEDGFE